MENSLYQQIKMSLIRHFDLRQEKENEVETIESLRNSVPFKGTNLWVLIFAVFLASLGLNMNSTAVVIGAMLISPLMGPIMGFGLGLGITDFDLVKRSFRHYLSATFLSVATSTVFFLISPISEAQSELLARTSPSIYDVLIATFGGLAGIVASSTKSKGNVIPGVAIATALMPPLCTAGFGLATGNLSYFFGAFYLYFINTVFISVATYVVVRLLKYPRKAFVDKKREKTVKRYITLIVISTIVPSIYLSYRVFETTFFEQQVRAFVNEELNFPNTQILNKTITDKGERKEIKVILLGETVPDLMISAAKLKLPKYGLENIDLVVQQGFGTEEVDINELKNMLMKDLYTNSEEILKLQAMQIDSLKHRLDNYQTTSEIAHTIVPEMRVLYPDIQEVACTQTYIMGTSETRQDTVMLVYLKSKKKISVKEQKKISEWLSARTKEKNIKLLIDR